MDVNPQRVAVVAARTANPRDSDFTCAYQVILFPFAATLEVTNATIAIYDEDNGEHSVELTQRFARASAFTHVLLLKSPQEIRPTIDTQKALLLAFPG
ncbi:hypothetical protein ACVXG9_16545 [Escherichia coli]